MLKKSAGIIQIIPLLLVAFLAVSVLAITFNHKPKSTAVLSESNDGSPERIETPEPKETPEPTEAPESEIEVEKEVKNGSEEAKIKIRSGKNKFEFQQEGAKISVESNFPLSVNPTTRELTVTTESGSKVVAILPQQAVDNMIANGVISSTSGVSLNTQADGGLAYSVDGTKSEKLLGVFGVSIPKTIVVSAQTGQVLVVNQSTFARILDLLSV